MGLQFYNINRPVYEKPVSSIKNTNKVTTLKKNSKRNQFALTAENLAFLRSLKAI